MLHPSNFHMIFSQVISTLSKSSSSAVSTLDSSKELQAIKNYLYVETSIEKIFVEWLGHNKGRHNILFLCGSSGDGKSEILTRNYQKYERDFDFHLDGTHSYHPSKNAIQTLDEQFDGFKAGGRPLVIGINIGMLGNYCNDGASEHEDIKTVIKDFLQAKQSSAPYEFLSFDDYPKYVVKDGEVKAQFVESLLAKITAPVDSNPFYTAFTNAKGARGRKSKAIANYDLLCDAAVQRVIVKTILIARLRFNLFLTVRTLLDAFHHLIAGGGHLFDNLFSSKGGELLEALRELDPNNHRDKKVDMFLIHQSLDLKDEDFEVFKLQVIDRYSIEVETPESWIRFFYLMLLSKLGNDFHREFQASFTRDSLDLYVDVWRLHSSYDGSQQMRTELRDFYTKYLIKSITRYGNRQNPGLSKRSLFFIKKLNGYTFAAKLKVEPNIQAIQQTPCDKLGAFHAHLKVGATCLKPLIVDAGLFDLIVRINQGYRPNKYDKSSIVILEEVIEELQALASSSSSLVIDSGESALHLTYGEEFDEIQIEG